MSSTTPSKIKTRLLILSDTHGLQPHTASTSTDDELSPERALNRTPTGYREPLPAADVALHCGDLTKHSLVGEYRSTLAMLRAVRAPLKLFICGNHDCALDEAFYLENWCSGRETEDIEEIGQLIRDAETDGVRYLTEGTYTFHLSNGAKLRIFASQYTPEYGFWAFQYEPGEHHFPIPRDGVDVVMTHGPPAGVLDTTIRGDSAGCDTLLRAVASSRPQVHCFGHIHESWGAYLAKWETSPSTSSSSSSSSSSSARDLIDANNSRIIQSLARLKPQAKRGGTVNASDPKYERLLELSKQRGFHVDLTEGEDALSPGEQTLFVNAAIMDVRYHPTQLPWIIDIDLDKAE